MQSREQCGAKLNGPIPDIPEYYVVKFKDMLRRKGLDPLVFQRHPNLTEESPLTDHVAFLFDNILSIRYATQSNADSTKTNNIARMLHGVQHAVRVAKLVMVFANLGRRYGDLQAMDLTEAEVKRMQLMAMFHDCAREDDLKDATDYESAIILYHYLTKVIGMNPTNAQYYAEIVGNKEESEQLAHFNLWLDETNQCNGYILTKIQGEILQRQSAAMECLYDSDCLDVMRVRSKYRGQQLNFYKYTVRVLKTKLPLEELSHLICEWRSIIDLQGDSFRRLDLVTKTFYEDRAAWGRFEHALDEEVHPIVSALSKRLLSIEELVQLKLIDISPYNPQQDLTERNLRAAMREGRVFVRSVCSPSAYKRSHPAETMAGFELRKLFRQPGIPATPRMFASREKCGNRVRSVSMLEKGAGTYGRAGFLFLDPRLDSIKLVGSTNMRTGFGKKKDFLALYAQQPQPRIEEIEEKLQALLLILKLGGHGGSEDKATSHLTTNTEILCDFESVNAIYYTNDLTLYRLQACKPFQKNVRLAPLIEAIYLRKMYQQYYEAALAITIREWGEERGREQFTKRFGASPDLPIFYVSGLHHVLHKVPEEQLTDDYIITYWKAMVVDYLKTTQKCLMSDFLIECNLDQFKIDVVSGNESTNRIAEFAPADECYDDMLKARLNRELETMIQEHISDTEIQYCSMVCEGLLTTKDEIVKIAFLSAVKHGHTNIVYQLLALDRTLCEVAYNQLYPLHFAVINNQPIIVRILLEHFAHADIVGGKGVRPLHCAVSAKNEESLMLLLSANASINVADEQGITPLMIAAANGNTNFMNRLIHANANVNAATVKGESALSFAIRHKSQGAINFLFERKLDFESKAILGEVVIAAVETNAENIIDLLEERGVNLELALQHAVDVNHYDVCFYLMSRHVSAARVSLGKQVNLDITYLIEQTKTTTLCPK